MSKTGIIRAHSSIWDTLQPATDSAVIFASLYFVKLAAHHYVTTEVYIVGVTAMVAFLLLSQVTGLHRRWSSWNCNQEVLTVLITWLMTLLALVVIGFLTRYTEHLARSILLSWAILAPCLVALTRMLARVAQRSLLKRGIGVRKVAIAGLNTLGKQVAENIEQDAGLGLKLYGFFDDRNRSRTPEVEGELDREPDGGLDALLDMAKNGDVDIVLLTLPMRAESRIRYVLDMLSDTTASVYIVPDFFVFELLHSRWTSVGGLPAVSVFENPLYGVDGIMKRTVDISLATCALIVAAVPMSCIALGIKLTSRGPVFFRQRRYGLDGREIKVWKFRSMSVCDDGNSVKQATKGDSRITPLGSILRRTSLDELPQLFNVLDGSMSLVGPRPHASAHNEFYRGQIHGYMLRHKVKPGITGLAQVSGCRGETDTIEKMERRIEWDHRYIRQWSIWLDIKILAKTLLVAWKQPEAY